jgi:hypothetical protein
LTSPRAQAPEPVKESLFITQPLFVTVAGRDDPVKNESVIVKHYPNERRA